MTVYMTGLYEKILLHIREDEKEKTVDIPAADYISNVVSSVFSPVYQDTVISVFILLVRLYLSYQFSLGYKNNIYQDESSVLRYTCNKEIYLNIKRLTDELADIYFIADGEPYNFCSFSENELEQFRQYAVNLADSGLCAEMIFSNYFSDIKNMRLYCRENYSKAFPLRYGYSGDEVKLVRRCMDNIAAVVPSIPCIRHFSGWYDTDMVTAVKCFQKNDSRRETGEISRALCDKLIYRAVLSLSFFEAIGVLKNLNEKEGEVTDDDIKAAVKAVAVLNPLIGDVSSVSVESFCSYYRIQSENRNSITEKLRIIWNAVSEVVPEYILYGYAQPFSGEILCYGDCSSDVSKIESYLKVVSEFVPGIGVVIINGRFDDIMLTAVKKFQNKYALKPDGKIGMFTWSAIANLYNYFRKKACNP